MSSPFSILKTQETGRGPPPRRRSECKYSLPALRCTLLRSSRITFMP